MKSERRQLLHRQLMEISIKHPQRLFMRDQSDGVAAQLLQDRQEAQHTRAELQQGLAIRWTRPQPVRGDSGYIGLYGKALTAGENIVKGSVGLNRHMQTAIDDLGGLPGARQLRNEDVLDGNILQQVGRGFRLCDPLRGQMHIYGRIAVAESQLIVVGMTVTQGVDLHLYPISSKGVKGIGS